MKEEYYVTVRNNPFHPATLIENIVFAALGLFLLYQNNAPIAHASKKNWRIVFHEQTEESLSDDQIKEIATPESEYPESPILKSIALEFSPSTSYIKSDDYEMDQLIENAAKECDFSKVLYTWDCA